MADIKVGTYPSSANQTVTALNSLATSSTWLAGWEGEVIDNTTDKYLDRAVTLQVTAGTSPTGNPGEIRLYFVSMLDDSTWPDVFDGTAGTETVTSAYIRDAVCRIGASTLTDTTSGRVYTLHVPSLAEVFKYNMPAKCVPFITHNMGVSLASSGNQLTVKGSYLSVA